MVLNKILDTTQQAASSNFIKYLIHKNKVFPCNQMAISLNVYVILWQIVFKNRTFCNLCFADFGQQNDEFERVLRDLCNFAAVQCNLQQSNKTL